MDVFAVAEEARGKRRAANQDHEAVEEEEVGGERVGECCRCPPGCSCAGRPTCYSTPRPRRAAGARRPLAGSVWSPRGSKTCNKGTV